jgi:predicted NUDIX family NTP pyrophosphohydrolase
MSVVLTGMTPADAPRGRRSAGILLFRQHAGELQVFLVHPGGPFWARRDEGAWSIPKGEYQADEDGLQAARREFLEETGTPVDGTFLPLPPARQSGGKVVTAWAVEGECDPAQLHSNMFELEWPPKSGRRQSFPEVDRAAWFNIDQARSKLLRGQVPLLEALLSMIQSKTR